MSGAGGFVTWVAEHEKTLGLAAAAIGTAAGVLWSKLSALRIPKSWVEADREGGVAPKLQPEGPHVATSHEADQQIARAQRLRLESELLDAHDHMRRIRRSLDDLTVENASQSRSLLAERAENERLRSEVAMLRGEREMLIAKAQSLLAEMNQLRAEGPPELPRSRER